MSTLERCLSFLLTSLLFSTAAAAQCGLIVNAGEDVFICNDALPYELAGVAAGAELLGTAWSPASAVTDPGSLVTDFTADTTTVLTLTGFTINEADNLLVNPEFTDGDMGFTTEYLFAPGGAFGPLSDERTYMVSTNAGLTHNNFAACEDHTPGPGGQMMVVNGATTPNENVYCQVVTVIPNTTYGLRAWVTSVISENPAQLQFSVNGALVGNVFSPSSATCSWAQFDDRWASGSATSAEICIVNQNTQGSGNDFALDDLFFGPVCEQRDELTITVGPPLSLIPPTEVVIPCDFGPEGFPLNVAGANTGPNYTHLWFAPFGGIVSGADSATVLVDRTGVYIYGLTYTDGENSCGAGTIVTVVDNEDLPTAVAEAPQSISCTVDEVLVLGQNSSNAPQFSYLWTTVDGNIVTFPDRINIRVNAAGTYVLTVTGPGDCVAVDSVTVLGSADLPVASIDAPERFGCSDATVVLDASASDSGPDLSATWITSDGTIAGQTSEYTIIAGSPGTYTFRLTNNATGCSTTQSITVGPAENTAVAAIEAPAPLDCTTGLTELSAMGSTAAPGTTYQWSTSDGMLSGPTDASTTMAAAAGTYTLLVTDANGCTATATTVVIGTVFNPTLTLSTPQLFTCDLAQIRLQATLTPAETVSYRWRTSDGNIVSDSTTAAPLIDRAGTYMLTVTDLNTGCTASETIAVAGVTNLPVAVANPDSTLTCRAPTLVLSTAGSSTGALFTDRFENADGTPLSSSIVSEAGVYILRVINTENNCAATDTVRVSVDTVAPLIDLAISTPMLTCTDPLTVISTLTPAPNYTYEWEGLSTADSLTVGSPGTYNLRVTDQNNGCVSTAAATITADQTPPAVSIDPPAELNCTRLTVGLNGMSDDPVNTAIWMGDAGVVSADLTTTVSAPGRYQLTVVNPANGCVDSAEVVVTQDLSPAVATISGADTLNCVRTSLELTAVTSGQGYTWSTGGGNITTPLTRSNITVDQSGVYYLTATNPASTCTALDSVEIIQNATPPVNTLADEQVVLTCTDTVFLLSGAPVRNPDFTYNWSVPTGNTVEGSSGPMIPADSPGHFVLTIINLENNCRTVDSTTVLEDITTPVARISAPDTLTCDQPVVTLVGGNALAEPALINWFGPGGALSNTDTLLVTDPGVYRLTLRNAASGCVDSAEVAVSLDTIAPSATIAGADILDCLTENIQLQVPVAERNDRFRYTWTGEGAGAGDGEEAVFGVTQGGDYSLLIRDTVNGCTQQLSVAVEQDTVVPTLQLPTQDTLNCLVAEVTGAAIANGAPGRDFRYTWTTADGTITTGAATPSVTVAAAGIYSLEVTDPVNNCRSMGSWVVLSDFDQPEVEVPTMIETSFCGGMTQAINLEADAEYTYNWQSRGAPILTNAGQSITVDAPGFYDVTITDAANGCADSYSVEITEDDLTNFTVQVVQPNCNSATGRLRLLGTEGGMTPYLLSADSGATFLPVEEVLELDPGDYGVVLQDANGCEVAQSVNIEEVFQLEVALPREITIRRGDSVQLEILDNLPSTSSLIVDSVVWSPAIGLNCSNCPSPLARPFSSRSYSAEVFTSDGCSARTGVDIIVDERETVYFPTAFSPNGDGQNDRFHPLAARGRVSEVRDFRVFDRWGSLVFEAARLGVNDPAAGWDGLVGGRAVASGVYVYSAVVVFSGGGEGVVYSGEVVLLR